MEEKEKLEWTLEEKEAEVKQEKKEIDKIALADYVLSFMPQEIIDELEQGRDVSAVMIKAENDRLKKENELLKTKLAKAVKKPLMLNGEGGENPKDPFALGFVQAMTDY